MSDIETVADALQATAKHLANLPHSVDASVALRAAAAEIRRASREVTADATPPPAQVRRSGCIEARRSDPEDGTAAPVAYLTPGEHRVMDLTASLADALRAVIGDGPTADSDWSEVVIPLHVVQNAVLAQAAARAYPDRYRLMGQTLVEVDSAVPDERPPSALDGFDGYYSVLRGGREVARWAPSPLWSDFAATIADDPAYSYHWVGHEGADRG